MTFRAPLFVRKSSAFTMMEIAISLAVIGIALVAIVGVLPLGMRVQRDNREQTVIDQDASVFIEAIRNGARGADDLTNYVYLITNSVTVYPAGTITSSKGYDNSSFLVNGTNIIGLLSTPEFTANDGSPSSPIDIANGNYNSNHVIAYVRSISGPAVEKPPQDPNGLIRADSFSYRILCVNAPVATDTNVFNLSSSDPRRTYTDQLEANLHEMRLTFLWPQLPNGNVGTGRQTYRALIAGQVVTNIVAGNYLYFYQPQSFTNAP
jgi:type II secretory pathway pseudopilin PulG